LQRPRKTYLKVTIVMKTLALYLVLPSLLASLACTKDGLQLKKDEPPKDAAFDTDFVPDTVSVETMGGGGYAGAGGTAGAASGTGGAAGAAGSSAGTGGAFDGHTGGTTIEGTRGGGGTGGGPFTSNSGTGGSERPRLVVFPADISFGQVIVGSLSAVPSQITITNLGPDVVTLDPSVTGPFGITNINCAGVAAGATCQIGLVFTPTSVGPAVGRLVIIPSLFVALAGEGINASDFTLDDKVDLGTVLVGVPISGAITVSAKTALAGLSCTTSGVEIAADPAKPCPSNLAAGTSCTFGFIFVAVSAGTKSASVVCSAPGAVHTTTVTAIAVTPASLGIQPPSSVAVFSPVGVASNVISFNVVNSGGSASGVLVVTPTGETADFIIDNGCIVVQPASFCKINVAFKPTSAGAKTLTVTITDPTSPKVALVATVHGSGASAPTFSISGPTTDFGTVAVGQTSAPMTFAITNTGMVDSAGITVSSSDAQFAIVENSCDGVALAPGKSCSFRVAFTPAVAGAHSCFLTGRAVGTNSGILPVSGTGASQ
jgi:hypothetical protein